MQIVGIVLAVVLQVLGDTWFPSSPCPDVFQYQVDSSGTTYALITIPAPDPNYSIKLEVVLGLDATLPSQYAGRIELIGDRIQVWRRLISGSKQPIQYRLHFPLTWPLPIVKQISMNGNIFCLANPQPTVTKLSLDHTLRPLWNSGFPTYIEVNKNDPNNQWNTGQIYRPIEQTTKVYYDQYTRPQANIQFEIVTSQPHYQPGKQPSFDVIPSQDIGEFRPVRPAQSVPPSRPSQTDDYIRPNHPAPVFTNIAPPRTKPPTTTTTTEAAAVTSGDECGVSIVGPLPLVYNGRPTEKGEWPWLVAMFVKSKSAGLQFQCGASLLSTTIVLTAAHCVKYRGRPEVHSDAIVLFIGKFNLQQWTETTSQVRDVIRVHIHPEFKSDDGTYQADLAVLVLKEAVQYSLYVRPICLWNFSTDINQIVGQTGTAVGWGKDERGTENSKPRKISMPIVSHADCILSNKEFVYYVSNRTFCAGKKDGTGPCSGDSGGGFMIGYQEGNLMKWYLRGVIHLSLIDKENMECDLHNYLIYTDVAMYMDWIREYVQ